MITAQNEPKSTAPGSTGAMHQSQQVGSTRMKEVAPRGLKSEGQEIADIIVVPHLWQVPVSLVLEQHLSASVYRQREHWSQPSAHCYPSLGR